MIGYLGPVGTFSYMAAINYTKKDITELKEYTSIYSLIKAADEGEIESAIVPIENSIEGSVNSTLDTLAFDTDLYICGEYTMKVCENLIANKGVEAGDIKKIISHPQPIGQCSVLINSQFPDALVEYTESTAAAAKRILDSGDRDIAMIGPSACAKLYNLEILISDCGNEKNNCTRFVELSKSYSTSKKGEYKTSIVFSLENKPGCLFRVIEVFAKRKVNMIKIESRPAKVQMGKYIFFIDVDGKIDDENIKQALEEISPLTIYSKCLGSYIKG